MTDQPKVIDWERDEVAELLKSAMYANALCACWDDSAPCALHDLDAFKVWLCAKDVNERGQMGTGYKERVLHTGRRIAIGDPSVLRLLYFARVPTRLLIYPKDRTVQVDYAQNNTSRTDVGSRGWCVRSKTHNWDLTHTCNLQYVQFVMAMLMPRPTRCTMDERGPSFEEVFDLETELLR